MAGRLRVKHTFAVPQVCIGCFWEERAKAQALVNKQLRAELLKHTNNKRLGRKPEPVIHERDEERDSVPDVLDEMSSMGKISLDD